MDNYVCAQRGQSPAEKGVDTLSMLKRAEGILDSIAKGVDAMLSDYHPDGKVSQQVRDHLYHQILGFMSMLLQAVYFENTETLNQIQNLGKCLGEFVELLKINIEQALHYWRDTVGQNYNSVQQLIQNDIRQIMNAY